MKWTTATLGSVAKIERDSVDPARIENGALYIGLENISRDGQLVDVGPTTRGELRSNKFRFDHGHVLYGKLRPNLSKVCSPGIEGICSTDILPIRPGKKLDQRYLTYYLRAPEVVSQATRLAVGINLPRLSPSALEAFEIPLPPIEEQRRIAAVLDAADALRAQRRQALAKLDTLTQAIFIDMFGDPLLNPRSWPRRQLGSLLRGIDSGKSPVCQDRPALPGEWGVLKLGAVTYSVYDAGENKGLPTGIAPDPRHEVRAGDVLFSRKNTRNLVAAAAYVHDTPPRLLLSDLIFRLVIENTELLDGLFLQVQLVQPRLRQSIQALAGGSAGSMPNISKEKLKEVPICLPPIDLQRQFSERAHAVRSSQRELISSAAHLDALFASLQQRAFRGEL